METALTPIIKESKVPQTVADQVNQSLTPFFAKVEEWKNTIKTIVITDPTETGKMKMAREGRLALRQMRLNGAEIVKANRDIIKERMESDVLEDKLWLKSGQVMELEYKTLEAQLEEKEKFAEVYEANRKKQLHITRSAELSQFGWQDLGLVNLGDMDSGSYAALLNGTKLQYEADKKAEAEAEKARLEQQHKDDLEQTRRKKIAYHGLQNYIPDFYSRKFCDLSEQEFSGVIAGGETAKNEYLENQRKIQQAKDQAESIPVSMQNQFGPQPDINNQFPKPGSGRTGDDISLLRTYAHNLQAMIVPGFATPAGKAIYDEARGYIAKVVARINAQAARL